MSKCLQWKRPILSYSKTNKPSKYDVLKKGGSLLGQLRIQSEWLITYNIASGEVAYGILGSQRDRAEHDEDQDEVGKDLMVDQLMAEYTKPTEEEIK